MQRFDLDQAPPSSPMAQLGQAAGHAANIEALAAEIEVLRKLTDTGKKAVGRVPAQHQPRKRMVHPSAPHNRARNKGRRTMGRHGDR